VKPTAEGDDVALPDIEAAVQAGSDTGPRPTDGATAVARSTDGRTFRVSGAGDLFVPGDVVVLTSGGTAQLGQVHEVRDAGPSGGEARGVLLGVLGPDGAADRRRREAFASGTAEPAGVDALAALQEGAGAGLDIGTWHAGAHELPARLRAAGFNRHTFLCGQSGSGKTYALGVILERLLLDTDLRMAVLDPNADFVGLGDVRGDAPEEAARRLVTQDVRVLRPDAGGGDPLRLRFATMDRRAQAAILQLDPLADREEYGALLDVVDAPIREAADVVARLRESGGAAERALAQRMVNLGIREWEVWARQDASAAEVLESGARAVVMDLGGFRSPSEPLAVTLDVLDHLWRERERRTPTLIVVDEAHNICGRDAPTPLHAAVTDLVVRIAAEGRKFGLWLLLSTQRPSKIHPQVLSQCDNLLLMRMNSPGDVAELAEVFGFAPPAMLGAAPYFVQGEALAAGTFAPLPSFVRMGARFTPEGGTDVTVPMPRG
jgi:hypothetical protein